MLLPLFEDPVRFHIIQNLAWWSHLLLLGIMVFSQKVLILFVSKVKGEMGCKGLHVYMGRSGNVWEPNRMLSSLIHSFKEYQLSIMFQVVF